MAAEVGASHANDMSVKGWLMLDCFACCAAHDNGSSCIAGPNRSRLGRLYETKAPSGNRFEQTRGVFWCILDHFLLFHALMPKMMATMIETDGRITPIMIWSGTLRPPVPPSLLLLDEVVEDEGGDVEGADRDVGGANEDVEGAEPREENGEEDEPLETVLHWSMLYWLTEELL